MRPSRHTTASKGRAAARGCSASDAVTPEFAASDRDLRALIAQACGNPVPQQVIGNLKSRTSMIHQPPWMKSILGITQWHTRRNIWVSDHSALAMKWCSDWCRELACIGSTRAAMGSTLLRDSGSIRPVQATKAGVPIRVTQAFAEVFKVEIKALGCIHRSSNMKSSRLNFFHL